MSDSDQPTASPPQETPFNWKFFLAVMLAPPVLSFLSALISDLPPLFTLLGTPISAIYCGRTLAQRMVSTSGKRTLAAFILVIAFGIMILTLCAYGCELGGFKMNMH